VYCMSKRPGTILTQQSIGFARPRELEITYKDDFNAVVAGLRSQMGVIRKSNKK
jgi:NitT/TauT family transport system ATP-binding protein